jgi:hypothetical protein
MGQKDASDTLPPRVRGMGRPPPDAGSDQAVSSTPRRKRVGEHETGMELHERP